ncbi:carbamoyltransferase HypF [Abyssalbus ytuae]|uniref:Carbamoyltransferase n=1 Tax=Abyssalbus ytuae TaxID=2926907 RepID=A0A9E6ZXR1_9FLAO|nr:carbamoyltransferase HypF [Abyssalbus ytuae]UOB17107.1 carbamoyltransferase HypF [Abyssalbus ytuae]
MLQKSYRIIITGRVQGVGFRPYVHSVAGNYGLMGSVSNNEQGVIIYVSGEKQDIFRFYKKIISNPPVVSKIGSHHIEEINFKKYDNFKIIPSNKKNKLNVQLTPDFAICDECKKEISDPSDRRYLYPFTTCVNCGPRWSITQTFPFERENTSIHEFEMCEDCYEEYTNKLNRRYHSQTNSCKKCGVKLTLANKNGKLIKSHYKQTFKYIGGLISGGKIIAIKNSGGYLLCCDATNPVVVNRLRINKNRPNKPFAVLYPSLKLLKDDVGINETQEKALLSAERPVVIVTAKNIKDKLASKEIAPGLNQLGVMLPYTAILQLLANELTVPVVATSGNIHGSPIISDKKEAQSNLSEVADYFLHHNLKIANPQDDSVIKYTGKFNHEILLRRSRGYAPNYSVKPVKTDEKIMALGADLKSTVAFLPNDYLYISQYLGNLNNYDVYKRFTETSSKFISLFEQEPEVILSDKHPDYLSTQYANELCQHLGIKNRQIQHHKAHFAAVLGENELFNSNDPVLGVIWDGTGYGDDGQIWGGEFFKYEKNKMGRITHFDYFDWLAGDKMAREPKLSMLALANMDMYPIVEEKFSKEKQIIYQLLKEENSLKTSSVGRLFDAVASLLNICDYNTYEGEAAMLLENKLQDYKLEEYKIYCAGLIDNIIPTKSIFKKIVRDHKKGMSEQQIIGNFFYTLANYVFQIANFYKIKKIALGGGVFQNAVLIDMIREIGEEGYDLFFNKNLSPNDENISYGQLMYYLNCRNDN